MQRATDSYSHEQAGKFLVGMFGDYLNDQAKAYIAICSSRVSQVRQDWGQEFHSDTSLALSRIAELHSQDRDVFFGVNPFAVNLDRRPTRKVRAIKSILRLHVDADFTDSSGLNRLLSLEPSAVIASGTKNRYHAYFNFLTPVPTHLYGEEVRRMNRRLTSMLGLKAEAFDITRTLRVPGTTNFKDRSNPQPVEIVEWKLERRYTLEECASRLGLKLGVEVSEPTIAEMVDGERGKYINVAERHYLDRLLRGGLFETASRNKAIMILIRHYYERDFSAEEIGRRVIQFFEQENNGLSVDWIKNPDAVRAQIRSATQRWFKKALPARSNKDRNTTWRLNRRDEAFIQGQELNDRDRLFLRDSLTWILNNQRDNNLVLSVRQLIRFTNCNRANYKFKREILYRLGILGHAQERDPKALRASEYKVLYQFSPPCKSSTRGRKRAAQFCLVEEVDKMLRAGASNQEIRSKFPDFSRQRIYSRRKRLDDLAATSRNHSDV